MKKSKVTANIGKNRLIFTFTGWVTRKDLDSIYTDTRFCVADLKPGFHVITDLSECSFGSLNCITTFRKIMNFLLENRAGQVIRITRSNSLIYKQIINLSARLQGYKPVYVTTFKEAEEYLEKSQKERELHFLLLNTPVHFSVTGTHVTGYVRDISTHSCSIESAATQLKANDKLLLKLELSLRDGSPQSFEIQSNITAVGKDIITVEFIDLEEERKQLLWKCIVYETQKGV